jgi:DNA polymerase III subunit delta'
MGLALQAAMRAGFLDLAPRAPPLCVIDGARAPTVCKRCAGPRARASGGLMPSVVLHDFPEPDRVEGAPHPRETPALFGHAAARPIFCRQWGADAPCLADHRPARGGQGDAGLAIARFLLATPEDDGGMFAPPRPQDWTIAPDHPVARRMVALSDPRLLPAAPRPNDTETAVAAGHSWSRCALKSFFSMTAADGGRRVDRGRGRRDEQLCRQCPAEAAGGTPANVTFLLVSHQPARLLPTIRSRCRELRLAPLPADLMAQRWRRRAPR